MTCFISADMAIKDMALEFLAMGLPIVLAAICALAALTVLLAYLRKRQTMSVTFKVTGTFDKKKVVESISGLFYDAGYRRVTKDEDELTFSKENGYNLVLGIILFLFLALPGILYLIFFGKELMGRIYILDVADGYMVRVDGPKKVIDQAVFSLGEREV